ncbi:MAG: hypothetical protein OHK0038_19850 [Flammeovirgaceae bacterium]
MSSLIKLMQKYILYLSFVFLIFQAKAQPTEKGYRHTSHWYSPIYTEYRLDIDKVIWGNLELRNGSSASAPEENYEFSTQLGYRHNFNTYWQGGVSLRNSIRNTTQINNFQVEVAHLGAIKSISFVKRLSLEVIDLSDNQMQNMARYSIYVQLARTFGTSKVKWQPMFSIQAFKKYEFDKDIRTLGEQRFIDLTRLQVSLNVLIDKNLTLSFFGIRQTEYYFAQATYDEEGNEKKPFRKLNLITPTWGMSVKCIFGKID